MTSFVPAYLKGLLFNSQQATAAQKGITEETKDAVFPSSSNTAALDETCFFDCAEDMDGLGSQEVGEAVTSTKRDGGGAPTPGSHKVNIQIGQPNFSQAQQTTNEISRTNSNRSKNVVNKDESVFYDCVEGIENWIQNPMSTGAAPVDLPLMLPLQSQYQDANPDFDDQQDYVRRAQTNPVTSQGQLCLNLTPTLSSESSRSEQQYQVQTPGAMNYSHPKAATHTLLLTSASAISPLCLLPHSLSQEYSNRAYTRGSHLQPQTQPILIKPPQEKPQLLKPIARPQNTKRKSSQEATEAQECDAGFFIIDEVQPPKGGKNERGGFMNPSVQDILIDQFDRKVSIASNSTKADRQQPQNTQNRHITNISGSSGSAGNNTSTNFYQTAQMECPNGGANMRKNLTSQGSQVLSTFEKNHSGANIFKDNSQDCIQNFPSETSMLSSGGYVKPEPPKSVTHAKSGGLLSKIGFRKGGGAASDSHELPANLPPTPMEIGMPQGQPLQIESFSGSPHKTQKEKQNNSGNMGYTKEKTKLIKKKYTELNNLVVAQELQCGNDAIWVIKFRQDGLFVAVGGNDGVLRVYKTVDGSSENPRQTFSSEPFRECRNHNSDSKDIFDIAWGSSQPNSNTILTACSDFTVYIYNIMTKNTSVASQFFDRPVQILKHPDLVSAAQFKIGSNDNLVVSGCFDKIVRVWNVKNRKVIDWQQASHYITALNQTVNGERLCVGLVNGDIILYDTNLNKIQKTSKNEKMPMTLLPKKKSLDGEDDLVMCNAGKLTLFQVIHCRNSRGKFASGRKVTGIEFLNPNTVMVTTNDSRIRFIDVRHDGGKFIYKIKGNKNETYPIRASLSDDQAHVVCASEDGDVFLWSQINSKVIQMGNKSVFSKLLTADKSDESEYFTPAGPAWNSQPITAAVFANYTVVKAQMMNQLKYQARLRGDDQVNNFINMIFVIGNVNGMLKIYHNETNYLKPSTVGRGPTSGGTGGDVFDYDEDDSPPTRH